MNPDCEITHEKVMLEQYMEQVRDITIANLDPLELAALYGDIVEFAVRFREQQEIIKLEAYME
jgi:hypothetical protein